MRSSAYSTPEFSRVVYVADIAGDGYVLDLDATADECIALAARFGLEAVETLTAKAELSELDKDRFCLKVTFQADVLQLCVVTLEPVASHHTQSFRVIYASGAAAETDAEVVVDAIADDPPEALQDSQIDVGEVTAQHLAMLIEPYPRSPEAAGEPMLIAETEDLEAEENPFRKLTELKGRVRLAKPTT